jgi:hypothetical protein
VGGEVIENTAHQPAADALALDLVEQVDREDLGLGAENIGVLAADRPAAREADDRAPVRFSDKKPGPRIRLPEDALPHPHPLLDGQASERLGR